ncbi:metallopeptidase family protein [Bifidobacterium primatium]|nr:metallopeptidase family protein [Bifidobacterium primatium]
MTEEKTTSAGMLRTGGTPLPWERKVYRNRHGRGNRQATFGIRMPRYRTKAGMFDSMVVAQLKRLNAAWPQLLDGVQCAVEDVPPSAPVSWETRRAFLSQSFPANHGIPARIVLYRRPIEQRAVGRVDLQLIIRDELVSCLADLSGKHPEDIDPDWGF